jgi:signal transduction histidine kinase/CheY-like chemotaxis protein
VTHRNVTGICDDPVVFNRFSTIASNIKKQAKMEGVLVNLQLAPHSVVCLVNPINNTEDFPEGVFMDNSGAIGHDLLTDPLRKFIAEATIPSDKVVIAGPLTLRKCRTCATSVEQGFIARLPIEMPDHQIVVDGVSYNRWGFAVAIINWKALVERSSIYANFEEENLQFQLTRTDKTYDSETDSFTEKVVVLAETPIGDSKTHGYVTTALQTTNNEWEMTVYYEHNEATITAAMAACVLIAFGISVLVYTILVQKQLHADAFAEQSAKMVEQARVAAKTERELNDYIAHEVRNPLSAAISACTFVDSAVHEREPLVDEASRIAVREDVGIIEISLQFVNDLLRSMLDLSRAASNQLTLDVMPVDVLSDIFQPVAAMLYNRDSMFKVLIECPDNLVVMTDRLRLKQIILNLGRNSLKFVEKGFVRLRADIVDGHVHLYIEDSGPGIPEDKRKQLFVKFQESLDVLSQGTGIGLSLCERLVELMGADIYLDESYDSGVEGCPGARFVLNMKISPVSVESLGCDADESGVVERQETSLTTSDSCNSITRCGGVRVLPEELSILFVDDDMLLRKLFTRSLRKHFPNWTVMEAGSGESALSIVESQAFDLIFLDQYMTSADKQLLGSEVARALRTKGCTSVICGLSANDMEQKFLASGANAFVMKPFPCKKDAMIQEMKRILCDPNETEGIA